jgi:hypothetical protein
MSHSVIIINNSLLDIFDDENPEYAGTRDHFTAQELSKIDEIRAFPNTHQYTFLERVFVSYVIDKAIFSAENP